MTINAWAAKGPNQPLEPYSYDPGPLAADDVEIAVETCGRNGPGPCRSRRRSIQPTLDRCSVAA
jgi:hypothetical protein